jgi:hypothetical protein
VAAPPDFDPKILEAKVEEIAPAKVVRPMRTPDSDDHLAAYFRQLAEHELLTPEDERELSQGIEDTEILTWERVLSRAEAVRPLLALVEPNLEQPVKFPKLQKVIDDMLKTKRARKDDKLVKKLQAAARETAVQLRALDLDRRCGGGVCCTAENAELFDFEIPPNDMSILDGLEQGLVTGWDPRGAP